MRCHPRYRLVALCIGFIIFVNLSAVVQSTEREKKTSGLLPKQLQVLKDFDSEFVRITPGKGKFPKSVLLGSETGEASERPVHKVTFEYRFSMAKYEVPQNLYEAVMGNNPSEWKGPRNSCESFTFRDATDFCVTATRLMRSSGLIEADEQIRLPTEAEWEYCCRAGTRTAFSFGDQAARDGDEQNRASILDEYGWHTGNAKGNDPPVGAKRPNAWGLYDMHGYLWEFVSDDWHEDYAKAPTDGSSWTAEPRDPRRVIRGGSWRDHYLRLRSAARMAVPAETRNAWTGFRCVKSKSMQR